MLIECRAIRNTSGRTTSKRRGWIFAVTIVYLFVVFPFASANSIDEALEASDSGVDFLEVALTGIYQCSGNIRKERLGG